MQPYFTFRVTPNAFFYYFINQYFEILIILEKNLFKITVKPV